MGHWDVPFNDDDEHKTLPPERAADDLITRVKEALAKPVTQRNPWAELEDDLEAFAEATAIFNEEAAKHIGELEDRVTALEAEKQAMLDDRDNYRRQVQDQLDLLKA